MIIHRNSQFRPDAVGGLYTYVPQSAQVPEYCSIPPETICYPTYGVAVGRGSFKYSRGKWITLRQTITLNTVSTAGGMNPDGKMLIQVDGKQVISFDKVVWRIVPTVKFVGIRMLLRISFMSLPFSY
jgi:hypothetical protein